MSQTDIVERLYKSQPTNCNTPICGFLKDEAADTITELREADESAKLVVREQMEIIDTLRERLDAVEKERLPHMCRADHVEIRHADSTSELCPLCRSNNMITQLRLSNERMREALKKLRRRDFPDDEEALWDEIQAALTAESGTEGKG